VAVSASEVKSIFNNLDASKSPGPDGITARLLKEVAPEISASVTSIFNKSLKAVFSQRNGRTQNLPLFSSLVKKM